MSLAWDKPLVAAHRTPVRFAGGWTGDGLRSGTICTWRGIVAADGEEVVAALVVEHFGAIGWSRSRRTPPDGLELALSVYLPDRADLRPWVNLAAGDAFLLWQAPWPGGSGLDVALGGETETGRLVSWGRTTGRDDPARFGLLLLARRDVRFWRKRIWRARPDLEAGDEGLGLLLRGPRWGWDPPAR